MPMDPLRRILWTRQDFGQKVNFVIIRDKLYLAKTISQHVETFSFGFPYSQYHTDKKCHLFGVELLLIVELFVVVVVVISCHIYVSL